MTTKYQLLVKKGPQRGHVHPLNAILITLGRDPLADIVISDPEVSRQHARLMETEDGYELQDLGSTNGTFVNGVQIGMGDKTIVRAGDQLRVGDGRFGHRRRSGRRDSRAESPAGGRRSCACSSTRPASRPR